MSSAEQGLIGAVAPSCNWPSTWSLLEAAVGLADQPLEAEALVATVLAPTPAFTGQAYTVTVGAGGAGNTSPDNNNASNGSDSVFSTITSAGGGEGAGTGPSSAGYAGDGLDGGSGGGGVSAVAAVVHPQHYTVAGNDGGS